MSPGFGVLLAIAAVAWVAWREAKSAKSKRRSRGAILLVGVLGFPLALAAQRVELGILGGWYQQTPSTHTQRFSDGASVESVRDGGGTIGAHVSVAGPRFGMTASVLQARSVTSDITFVDATGTVHQLPFRSVEFKSTFFVLQPHVRLPVSKGLEANVAVGPSFGHYYGRPEGTGDDFRRVDEGWNMALSMGLRTYIGPSAAIELKGSNMYRLESDQGGNRNNWIVGLGVAWALKQE